MRDVISGKEVAAFLNARLDEDEATAKRAAECALVQRDGYEPGDWSWLPSYGQSQPEQIALIDHQSRHDPARVLREVAAKRALLELHYPGMAPYDAPDGLYICAGEEADGDTWQMATRWPCMTVRLLAAVYSGHPDYRPEWSPDA